MNLDASYESLIEAVGAAAREWREPRKALREASEREHRAFWALKRARDEAYANRGSVVARSVGS